MTVSSAITRSGPYTFNGATTAFDYDFKVYDETHLRVVVVIGGVESDLVLGTDYTVSGVGSAGGGQITTLETYDAPGTLTIVPDVPFTQETDLENQGAYYAEVVERALDVGVMRDLQLQGLTARSIKLPDSYSGGDVVLPDAEERAGTILGFDADGALTTLPQAPLPAYSPAYRVVDSDTFAALDSMFKWVGADGENLALDLREVTPADALAAGDFDPVTKTGTDDTEAIMKAVNYATVMRVPLVIHARHKVSAYDYGIVAGQNRDTNGHRCALFVEGVDELTIEFRGGELWFEGTDRTDYGYVINAETVGRLNIFGEGRIDYVNLPYVQGLVTAIDTDYVEFVAEWAPTFTEIQRVNLWTGDNRVQVHTVKDRPSGSFDAGAPITNVSGLTYRLDRTVGTWDVTYLVVGSLITADHQIYACGGIKGFRVGDVQIRGVTINHCAGIAVWFRDGQSFDCTGIRIEPRAGTRNLLSSSADGINVCGYDRVTVRENKPYRTGDDLVNVHCYSTPVVSRDSGTTFTAQYYFPFILPDVGDRLVLRDKDTTDTQTVTVAARTDPGIPPANVGDFGTFTVTTVETLDTDLDSSWIMVSIEDGWECTISGNVGGWNRGRGIICQARNANIFSNIIDFSSMLLLSETFTTESGFPAYLNIKGNIGRNIHVDPYYGSPRAALLVAGHEYDDSTVEALFGTVFVEGNTIVTTRNTAIQVEGSDRAVVVKNVFYDVASNQNPSPVTLGTDKLAVAFVGCTFAYLDGNVCTGTDRGVAEVDSFLQVGSGNSGLKVPQDATYFASAKNSMRQISVDDAVNFFTVQGNLTTYPPTIMAAGTDTNISVQILPKGTGTLIVPLPTSSAGLPSGALWLDTGAGNVIKGVP